MESDDRRQLDDVPPTLKEKLIKLIELKKVPLEQLATVLSIHDTFHFTSVGELVSHYERNNQALSLEKWKLVFTNLQLSKELADLLADHWGDMMDGVDRHGSLPAEMSLPGTFSCSRDLDEPIDFSPQDKPFLLVNDPPLSLQVAEARACEYQGAIPERKQAQPPYSTVEPKVRQELLTGLSVRRSLLNQPPIPGGDFGNDCQFSSSSPQSIESAVGNASCCEILCNSSAKDENQETGFFSDKGDSHTQITSFSTAIMHTLALENEGNRFQNSEFTVTPVVGKSKHKLQSLASLSEDSNKQPDHLRTPARPNTPALYPLSTYVEDNPRAREYQGAIPKSKRYQPRHSTIKHDVRQELLTGLLGSESDLNLPSIQAGHFGIDCPQSGSPPPESIKNTLGHEDVQYQNSTSTCTVIPEVGKPKHQIQSLSSLSEDSNKQLHLFEITPARPTTPEGTQSGGNSPSLVTGRHNSRPNQTNLADVEAGIPENGEENGEENGDENGRAVEHYDATENNGLLEETQQELESLKKSVLYLAKKLEERDSFCQILLDDRFQLRQTLEESRQRCDDLVGERNNLQAENAELRRHLEENEQENRRLCLLAAGSLFEARRADDVASGGRRAVVELDHTSDSGEEVEPDIDEQPGSFPLESDADDSSDDEFYEARDEWFL
ncbi:uncharacterized protein LOC111340040 isoform X2 [Stylophora pistillata]|uniref:uncharacterized protein LOC111340040 isoform X2 n=1 Tax=Stylophora pistillata TaxID=50429 RepID=UPI000C04FA17|nr:uncharacterized protein LOC111340040 isoform X2 [Stylophora pistillata]